MRSRQVLAALTAVIVITAGPAARPALAEPTLDPSFGPGGFVHTDFGGGLADRPYAILVQPDGRIVVAGESYLGGQSYWLSMARYTADGALDAAGFGSAGRVVVSHGFVDRAFALALQPDGRIVAGGELADPAGGGSQPAVYRFEPDGSPDTSFNGNGRHVRRLDEFSTGAILATRVLPDGRILAAGRQYAGGGARQAFVLRRLTGGGQTDPGFGVQGDRIHYFDGMLSPGSAEFLPDGGVLFAATFFSGVVGDAAFVLARTDSSGNLVPSFGSGGFVSFTTPCDAYARIALAAQPDGKFLLAGSVPAPNFSEAIAVYRLLQNGALDPGFGTGGKVLLQFSAGPSVANAHDLHVLPDGRIVVFGRDDALNAVMARLLPDGALDPLFDTDGRAVLPLGSSFITCAAVASRWRFVTAGFDFAVNGGDYVVSRIASATVDVGEGAGPAAGFALRAPSPNPSRSATTFDFELPRPCRVVLDVYDAAGRRVAALHDGVEPAGRHAVRWVDAEGSPSPAGLYFARFVARDEAGRVLYRQVVRAARIR